MSYLLSPHAPILSRDDLALIHRLWLDAKAGIDVHHRDIVRVALEDLRAQLRPKTRRDVLADTRKKAARPISR